MLIKSSVIGTSPDGIYTIEKDTDRGMYYLKTNGKIADNEHGISFNAPSVETRLERWAEIYGVELNPEYLTNSKRPIKSVRDDRTGKEDYETKWEYVDELCDRAIESMGGDKDAMFFTQGLRDSDFAVKGHYIDIMEANGNYSLPNDLWADVCKSLAMEKLLQITEAKDRINYTLFVDWVGNGLMNNRKPIKSSRRPIKSGLQDGEVIFRASTRGGKNTVEVIDTGDSVDRYAIKQDGSMDYADTTKGVLAKLLKQAGWKEDTFSKIDVDTSNIGRDYLQIVKMINDEFGFLYKSSKGSRERQFYFDIIRFIAQNIERGSDMAIEDMIWKAKDALRAKGINSSRRPIKSGVPGYPDDYTPNKIYYIVVNGSKEYFMNENKARSVAYDLKFESPNVSGPYEETDPEEIAEVIDAGIIRSSRRPVKSSDKPWKGKKWDIYRPGVDEPYVTEDFDEMMRFKQDGFKVKLHKEESINQSFVVGKTMNDGSKLYYCEDNCFYDENNYTRPSIKIFDDNSEAEKIAKRSKTGFVQEL